MGRAAWKAVKKKRTHFLNDITVVRMVLKNKNNDYRIQPSQVGLHPVKHMNSIAQITRQNLIL